MSNILDYVNGVKRACAVRGVDFVELCKAAQAAATNAPVKAVTNAPAKAVAKPMADDLYTRLGLQADKPEPEWLAGMRKAKNPHNINLIRDAVANSHLRMSREEAGLPLK